MIKQLISIVIALMMMTTVCACGAGGKDSTGQAPEEKAVSETVSEEAQVPGGENTQVQESVESGEEIVSNTSDSEQHQETAEAVSQEAAPQETGEAASKGSSTAGKCGYRRRRIRPGDDTRGLGPACGNWRCTGGKRSYDRIT